jgi:DNA-binding CsgD family transcriptional regulator
MPGKVKTLKQIAMEYGVHRNTLTKWIKPIEAKLKLGNRRILLEWQVQMIYKLLDSPEEYIGRY